MAQGKQKRLRDKIHAPVLEELVQFVQQARCKKEYHTFLGLYELKP